MKKITIQPRDRRGTFPPRSYDNASSDQVMRALGHGLLRYKKAMNDLAKM